ncbi:unnamed protein product [Closterium sp. Naga37s-1]|nr:unnamed protein product [Closterium sp. Naga37s-1]
MRGKLRKQSSIQAPQRHQKKQPSIQALAPQGETHAPPLHPPSPQPGGATPSKRPRSMRARAPSRRHTHSPQLLVAPELPFESTDKPPRSHRARERVDCRRRTQAAQQLLLSPSLALHRVHCASDAVAGDCERSGGGEEGEMRGGRRGERRGERRSERRGRRGEGLGGRGVGDGEIGGVMECRGGDGEGDEGRDGEGDEGRDGEGDEGRDGEGDEGRDGEGDEGRDGEVAVEVMGAFYDDLSDEGWVSEAACNEDSSSDYSGGASVARHCSRTDGKGWVCMRIPRLGFSLCDHHIGKAAKLVAKKREEKLVAAAGDIEEGEEDGGDGEEGEEDGEGCDGGKKGEMQKGGMKERRVDSSHSYAMGREMRRVRRVRHKKSKG